MRRRCLSPLTSLCKVGPASKELSLINQVGALRGLFACAVCCSVVVSSCSGSGSSSPAAPTSTACSFAVAPLSFTVTADNSTAQRVNVTTTANCTWTATSNASFITINTAASGAVIFTIEPNPTFVSRIGTLTVAGQLVDVTQAAAVPTTDSLTVIGLSPTSGSSLPSAANSSTGVTATVRYTLMTRDTAFVCVLGVLTANTNEPTSGSCGARQVTRGTGTTTVTFNVGTSGTLPVTTTSLWLLMGTTAQFPQPFLASSFEPATFTWTRP